MEFPYNALTNVYKIGYINNVQWALYLHAQSEIFTSESTRFSPASSRSKLDVCQASELRNVEYELRSKGHHVLYDMRRHGVWAFSLQISDLSIKHEKNAESITQVTQLYSLRKAAAGVLCSPEKEAKSELDSPSSRLMKVASPEKSGSVNSPSTMNLDIFGTNFLIPDIQDKALQALDLADIFPKLSEAISMSFVYNLAKTHGWLPLGSRSCFCTAGSPNGMIPGNDTPETQPQFEPVLISIQVCHTYADLTISTSRKSISGLRRLSNASINSDLILSSQILVAPLGMIAIFCGDGDESGNISTEYTTATASYLARQGVQIAHNELWLRLYFRGACLDSKLIREEICRPSDTFFWPACLCFCSETSLKPGKRFADDPGFIKAEDIDPLLFAESWFLARASRAEAIETKRRNDELEALKLKDILDVDDKDSFADLGLRTNQHPSTQEANSIYPTPPDGLRSQGVGSSVKPRRQSSSGATGNEDNLNNVDDSLLNDSPFATSTGPGISSTSYQPDVDDLLGEMDSEMFTADGLTEADFSFFDEPTIGANIDMLENKERNQDGIESSLVPILHVQNVRVANSTLQKPKTDAEQARAKTMAVQGADLQDGFLPSNFPLDEKPSPDILSQKMLRLPHASMTSREEPKASIDVGKRNFKRKHEISFEPVPFEDKLESFDSKYVNNGRFGYETQDTPLERNEKLQRIAERMPPRLDLLNRNDAEQRMDIVRFPDQDTDHTESDMTPDITDSESDEVILGATEEWRQQDHLDSKKGQGEHLDPATSQISDIPKCSGNKLCSDATPSLSMVDLLFNPDNYVRDARFNCSSILRQQASKYLSSDREFMQIAHLVMEQLALQYRRVSATSESVEDSEIQTAWDIPSFIEDLVVESVSRFFPQSEQLSFDHFANMGGTSKHLDRENTTARPTPKEPNVAVKSKSSSKVRTNIVKLPPPYIRVRRNQKSIDILSTALHFWEELGLEPAHGAKNALGVCICPASDAARKGAETFLDMVGSSYQSCKLGIHSRASGSDGNLNGLFLVPCSDGSHDDKLEQLEKSCELLGTNLARMRAKEGNTIIYMVNQYKHQTFIPQLCASFLKLFKTYAAATKAEQIDNPNDLVLQIIPIDLISSSATITLTSPASYRKIAFEVYDRCGPNSDSEQNESYRFFCAPSIRLARPIPRSINIKLLPTPTAGLLQSDMSLHLAYAWSPELQWLIASWTDNQGDLQWCAPYYLGKPGDEEPWSILNSVVNEIWDTTLGMLNPINSSWRLFVAKDSPMHDKELEAWLSVSNQPSQFQVDCVLLTLNPDPPLHFPKPDIFYKTPNFVPYLYTPGSTPATHTFSSDPSGLASTPIGSSHNPSTPTQPSSLTDFDVDARLVDITDDSWGAILPQAIADPLMDSSQCSSAASGYLLKRAGSRDEDGLIPVGVDIIHAQKDKEGLLREVLGMYRDLALLARVRGLVHGVNGAIPWHIAVARNASEALNSLMLRDER